MQEVSGSIPLGSTITLAQQYIAIAIRPHGRVRFQATGLICAVARGQVRFQSNMQFCLETTKTSMEPAYSVMA